MEKRTEVLCMLKEQGRPMIVFRELSRLCGGVRAGTLLSYYCACRNSSPDGWFRKTTKELQEATGMGRFTQRTAHRILIDRGFLQSKHETEDPSSPIWVRLDYDAVLVALTQEESKKDQLPDPASLSNLLTNAA